MKALMSRRKADGLFLTILLAGLAILFFSQQWWPELFLPFALALMMKQWVRGRLSDVGMTFLVYSGAYLAFKTNLNWQVLMPILLGTGSLFLLFREYLSPKIYSEAEEEEELNREIEEESEK